MTWMLKLAAIGAAAVLATGTACAQAAPAGAAPAGPGLTAENPAVRNGGDTMDRDANAARDAAIANARDRDNAPKTARAVPAKPADVTVGSEVRDSKGVVIGTIESVSMASAVVAATGGKVEVPLEAFGKNNKGLLVGMTKALFDAAVAAAVKPASCSGGLHAFREQPGLGAPHILEALRVAAVERAHHLRARERGADHESEAARPVIGRGEHLAKGIDDLLRLDFHVANVVERDVLVAAAGQLFVRLVPRGEKHPDIVEREKAPHPDADEVAAGVDLEGEVGTHD